MSNTQVISVVLADQRVHDIDDLVKKGEYINRSDFVRQAILKALVNESS